MTAPERLSNWLGGQRHLGTGPGTVLHDPVQGTPLVSVDRSGLDLAGGFAQVRGTARAALQAMGYRERAGLLNAVLAVLKAHKAEYDAISLANSGTVAADTAVDVDGALYTLGAYAKLGPSLPEQGPWWDGDAVPLAKDGSFQSRHLLSPTPGLALFINAFNFPAWGLWEKAAPALLSGVPVVVKPATATAWLTQRMVADVVAAGVLPAGGLNVVCGSSEGLLDALGPMDVCSFTGSAATAALLRRHPAVAERSLRLNVEADSVNAAWLLEDGQPGTPAFDLLVREVAREMTVKSGQKCTAIRRVLVPQALYGAVAEAIAAQLAKTTCGDPRVEGVRMGALVNRAQFQAAEEGLATLGAATERLHDGRHTALVGVEPGASCCMAPTLLGTRDAAGSDAAAVVHDVEVFGPVATLLPYRDARHAQALIERGQGSLVASVYGNDTASLAQAVTALAPWHGRVHAVDASVASTHTGHGNVMPQSLHGGPGRAGGGEELGGLRALNFYHRRSAVQASADVLRALEATPRAVPA